MAHIMGKYFFMGNPRSLTYFVHFSPDIAAVDRFASPGYKDASRLDVIIDTVVF